MQSHRVRKAFTEELTLKTALKTTGEALIPLSILHVPQSRLVLRI